MNLAGYLGSDNYPILARVRALEKHYREIDSCLVVIDRESGHVLTCLGELPFTSPEGLEGRDWQDALAIPGDGSAVIARAMAAGVAAALPPFIVGAGADTDYLMGGMVVPQSWEQRPAALLFLRRLSLPWGFNADEQVGFDDVVAVLGVDRLEFSPSWGVPETETLMMELRSGLQQLLRDTDWLGLPEGANITVILKGMTPEEALDVSRALLSHLHQGLGGLTGGAQYARACIGLSQRLYDQPPITALVAANTALLQAQAGGDDRIRFSSPWDPLGQAARALNATGVFRDTLALAQERQFLGDVVAIATTSPGVEAFCREAVGLAFEQGGLTLAALLATDSAGHFDVIAAVAGEPGKGKLLPGGRLPRGVKNSLRGLLGSALESGAMQLTEQLIALPLQSRGKLHGCFLLQDADAGTPGFRPSEGALQILAEQVMAGGNGPQAESGIAIPQAREMEKGIEGYVLDNMEGAIDQAVFLSRVDMPVAIVGERGTGKMYVAQIIHSESGGHPQNLVRLDCRSFRNRREAWSRISRELQRGDGHTLVFKAPQLLHPEIQSKLARQLASRTATEQGETRYLAPNRYIALLPESPQRLLQKGDLDERLASVFAGYPILVPPLRERPRAVLRWAHKILEQESTQCDRRVLGFTPDAERALLQHKWAGNISEMRAVLHDAMERADKEWVSPVDLGLFVGISADGRAAPRTEKSFLDAKHEDNSTEAVYSPSAGEALRVALGEALAALLQADTRQPLGAWLDDEVIDGALERSGGDSKGAAEFLQVRTRNIGRWLPKVRERDAEREASALWQPVREPLRQWVLESTPGDEPPQEQAERMLMSLIAQQCEQLSTVERAKIMGVSTPTYQKRLKQRLQNA